MTDNYAENAILYSLILLNMPRRTENKLQYKGFKLYFKWHFKKMKYFRYLKWSSMDIIAVLLWKQIKRIFNQNISNWIYLLVGALQMEWLLCYTQGNPSGKSCSG